MAIENFDEVKTYLDTNKDKDDVKAFVSGLNPVTLDKVKSLVNSNSDFKSWFDSEKDTHASKSLETWKTNHLSDLVDKKYKELHPDADPKDEALAKVQKELADMKSQAQREKLTNFALKTASEHKLPTSIVNYFLGEDEKATKSNLEALEKAFNDSVNSVAEERLKSGYQPPKSDKDNLSAAEKAKADIMKAFGLK